MDCTDRTTLELRLLFACARTGVIHGNEGEIRRLLSGGIDWTLFAQEAIDRGLASRVGHALLCMAPDMVPAEIRDAFGVLIGQTRMKNRELLDQLPMQILANSSGGAVAAIDKACAMADRALDTNPNDATAWSELGDALSGMGRHKAAMSCHDRAISLAPDDPSSWTRRGIVRLKAGQPKAGIKDLDKALSIDPKNLRAWSFRPHALLSLQRFAEAADASDRALMIDPGNTSAVRSLIHALLFSCDWPRRDEIRQRIGEGAKANLPVITPFLHLAISSSEAENHKLARLWARAFPQCATPLWRGERHQHGRIRIAYISTDFRDTLSVNAIAGCFEGHDKTRFETTAISLTPSDGSDTRRRIESAFDHFIDAQGIGDAHVARMLREAEIDIAIDLNGYSGDKRTGIFAFRPAPVQVNYLGFAGTMGMPFIDYIIADRIVIPDEHKVHYSEKVVYLPHSFFPTDRRRRISEHVKSRTEAGLPEGGFVFACHNTAYKITPEMFDIWMRLLRTVAGSVLWLSSTIPQAMVNLQREAKARGVDPERLVFGPRVPERADHLARLRLADLFLDTLPYNAHTTACDALWTGLPVLTCMGSTFPARVAASLLHAMGLPELVTNSLSEYEDLARALAMDPARLGAIRLKLLCNRDTEPLFDTVSFTRYLEAAYVSMWERHAAGLPPLDFTVAR